MRCHWESLGVLGPMYELVSQGLSDRAIANKLNLNEVTVHGCISWLSHSLRCRSRAELVLLASTAQRQTWSLSAAA